MDKDTVRRMYRYYRANTAANKPQIYVLLTFGYGKLEWKRNEKSTTATAGTVGTP
jgi:hypothetical protein